MQAAKTGQQTTGDEQMFLLFQLMVNVVVSLIPAHDVQVENGEVWTTDRPEQYFGPEHKVWQRIRVDHNFRT